MQTQLLPRMDDRDHSGHVSRQLVVDHKGSGSVLVSQLWARNFDKKYLKSTYRTYFLKDRQYAF
jgi:hypothetical protein